MVLKKENLNPNVLEAQYAVRGTVVLKAIELQQKLKSGEKLNFDEIIYCNIGNPQQVQQLPLSFPRQVLSLFANPKLIENENISKIYPKDVIERAKLILSNVGNSGAYTHSQGLLQIRQNVAKFIEQRDGFPSNPNRIFLSNGASSSIQLTLQLLIRNEKDGIMIPKPQYPLYSATITLLGGSKVSYELDESKGWGLSIEELEKSYQSAMKDGINVRALTIINPGNPTGQCLNISNQKEIIKFCEEKDIVLLADEVYQENVYGDINFTSFKKTVCEMKSNVELFSYHSTSKGFFGECGRRGGYMEISESVDEQVIAQIYKTVSIQLCPNLDGQIIMDLMVNPPKQGDESYDLYVSERDSILNSLKKKAKFVVGELRKLEGVTCNDSTGAMYVFPQIRLPSKSLDESKKQNISPDLFYCLSLLEETGICCIPGSGFGQKDGTYHFRSTFLPPVDKMEIVAQKMKLFHENFMKKWK
eukprot:gene2449-3159_t